MASARPLSRLRIGKGRRIKRGGLGLLDAKMLTLYSANQGDHSMSIGTILMIAALLIAITVLAIGLRPPPLYGPPEKDDKPEGEPPDSDKSH
jgi:hypothetical protein